MKFPTLSRRTYVWAIVACVTTPLAFPAAQCAAHAIERAITDNAINIAQAGKPSAAVASEEARTACRDFAGNVVVATQKPAMTRAYRNELYDTADRSCLTGWSSHVSSAR